jgi:hypothetical protein
MDEGKLSGKSLLQALQAESTAMSTLQSAQAAAAQKAAAAAQKAAAQAQARFQNLLDPLKLEVQLSRAEAFGKSTIPALRALLASAKKALASAKSLAEEKAALDQITQLNQALKSAQSTAVTSFTVPAKLQLALAKDAALGKSSTKDLLKLKAAILKFIRTHKNNIAALTDAYNQLAAVNQQLGATATSALGLFKQASTKAANRRPRPDPGGAQEVAGPVVAARSWRDCARHGCRGGRLHHRPRHREADQRRPAGAAGAVAADDRTRSSRLSRAASAFKTRSRHRELDGKRMIGRSRHQVPQTPPAEPDPAPRPEHRHLDGVTDAYGRVLIAFDDGPLEPAPTWTRLDGGTPFPSSFVASYEITSGRQGLLSQTDTGEATVDINDRDGLFDPRNVSSAYYGKLDGRQILLQLYDPVRAVWEPQFQGHIDNVLYDVDGSGVDQNGDPINVAIRLECVDIFDYLAGYGLTPGLAGVAAPSGGEDGVWYAATTGTVDDRIIEILTDIGIDSTRWNVTSGNVKVIAVKYDPDESALVALRDACDAEFPFIANMYVDRRGMFSFRGRYSRFDPDGVAAEPGSTWDFTRWPVGDGNAIIADSSRAQMRVLSYGRGRRDVINVAIATTQGIAPADVPGQVFANTASITAYGQHAAPPMSDLLTSDYAGPGTISPTTGKKQCALYAELLVKNQKDPRESITALQLKAIQPTDPRASATWAMLTQADIAHIINVKMGYPGGTGFSGASPADDYYIEGRRLRVDALNTGYDYVEADYELSPAVWSMDTHSVFPAFGS